MAGKRKTTVLRSSPSSHPNSKSPDGKTLVIDQAVGALIAVTSRLMDRMLNAKLLPHGVSFGQWPLLMNLFAEEGISQRELSRRVFIEEGTAARTLDRMEAEGLIRRERDQADRRQQNIYLTDKGRDLQDVLVPVVLKAGDFPVENLSPEEIATLCEALRKMIAKLTGALER